jgi:hypothetical protein
LEQEDRADGPAPFPNAEPPASSRLRAVPKPLPPESRRNSETRINEASAAGPGLRRNEAQPPQCVPFTLVHVTPDAGVRADLVQQRPGPHPFRGDPEKGEPRELEERRVPEIGVDSIQGLAGRGVRRPEPRLGVLRPEARDGRRHQRSAAEPAVGTDEEVPA